MRTILLAQLLQDRRQSKTRWIIYAMGLGTDFTQIHFLQGLLLGYEGKMDCGLMLAAYFAFHKLPSASYYLSHV